MTPNKGKTTELLTLALLSFWLIHSILSVAPFSGNYTTSIKKKPSEFCAYAASKKVSTGLVVPDATTGKNGGADPFRTSHLANVDAFVEQGFGRETTIEYLNSVRAGLESPNIVTDARFPGAAGIYFSLDFAIHEHLNASRLGLIDGRDLAEARDHVR